MLNRGHFFKWLAWVVVGSAQWVDASRERPLHNRRPVCSAQAVFDGSIRTSERVIGVGVGVGVGERLRGGGGLPSTCGCRSIARGRSLFIGNAK